MGHLQDCPQSVPQRHCISLLGTSLKHHGMPWAGALEQEVSHHPTVPGSERLHMGRSTLETQSLCPVPLTQSSSPTNWAGKAQQGWGGRMD